MLELVSSLVFALSFNIIYWGGQLENKRLVKLGLPPFVLGLGLLVVIGPDVRLRVFALSVTLWFVTTVIAHYCSERRWKTKGEN